jgi:hypothetical protein
MNQDEIIEMAIKTNILEQIELLDSNQWRQDKIRELEAFAKLVAAKERERYMQLFLDPENQPTQFGTATQEYREQEIKDEREACAKACEGHDLWGPLAAKTIRARGEA